MIIRLHSGCKLWGYKYLIISYRITFWAQLWLCILQSPGWGMRRETWLLRGSSILAVKVTKPQSCLWRWRRAASTRRRLLLQRKGNLFFPLLLLGSGFCQCFVRTLLQSLLVHTMCLNCWTALGDLCRLCKHSLHKACSFRHINQYRTGYDLACSTVTVHMASSLH